MRVLHTADWHVGKTINRQYRYDEMRDVLGEIVGIAEDWEIDVAVIAGDVYETKAPSGEAENVVYGTLLQLSQLGIPVVIVRGNHDHEKRWRAIEPLLDRFDVRVVPTVRRPDEGGVLEVEGRNGEPLQIAALPWVGKRRYATAESMMNPDREPHSEYAEGVSALLDHLAAELDTEKCNMLAAHVFVSGAIPGGGERPLVIGETYGIPPQAIPQVQYAALGHVHRPQEIGEAPVPTRYCGSPLQFDFGEVGYENSVTVVDLEAGQPAKVEEVTLTEGRSLRNVHGTLEELEEMTDAVGDDYLRVHLECEKPQPGMGDQVRDLLPNVVEVRLEYPEKEERQEHESLRDLTPRKQFARYLSDRYGGKPDEEFLDLFDELLDEVEGGYAS